MTASITGRLDHTADQLFFVVGMGRSGTSLLHAMLASHPDVSMPPETQFFTVVQPEGQSLGGLTQRLDLARALDHALAYRQIQEMELDRQTVTKLTAPASPTWDTVFLALLTAYADKAGASRIGEKTPGHLRHIDHLQDAFPRARFVHIIRDPRAVVQSWREVAFASGWLAPRIRDWKRTVELHRLWEAALGSDRYRLIRYEDLVQTPEETLKDLCRFVGLDFTPAMLEHEHRSQGTFGAWQEDHMANTLKPVFTSSIDRWRTSLSRRQVALTEQSLAIEMEVMGYETTGARTALRWMQIVGGMAADFIWRSWRRVRRRSRPRHTD